MNYWLKSVDYQNVTINNDIVIFFFNKKFVKFKILSTLQANHKKAVS